MVRKLVFLLNFIVVAAVIMPLNLGFDLNSEYYDLLHMDGEPLNSESFLINSSISLYFYNDFFKFSSGAVLYDTNILLTDINNFGYKELGIEDEVISFSSGGISPFINLELFNNSLYIKAGEEVEFSLKTDFPISSYFDFGFSFNNLPLIESPFNLFNLYTSSGVSPLSSSDLWFNLKLKKFYIELKAASEKITLNHSLKEKEIGLYSKIRSDFIYEGDTGLDFKFWGFHLSGRVSRYSTEKELYSYLGNMLILDSERPFSFYNYYLKSRIKYRGVEIQGGYEGYYLEGNDLNFYTYPFRFGPIGYRIYKIKFNDLSVSSIVAGVKSSINFNRVKIKLEADYRRFLINNSLITSQYNSYSAYMGIPKLLESSPAEEYRVDISGINIVNANIKVHYKLGEKVNFELSYNQIIPFMDPGEEVIFNYSHLWGGMSIKAGVSVSF